MHQAVAAEIAAEFERSRSSSMIWALVESFAQERGFNRAFYLHVPPPGAREFPSYFGGCGAADRYVTEKLYLVDPCVHHALHTSEPFELRDICRLRPLTPPEQAFFADMEANEAADGVGVPVFGPAQRNGYVELGRPRGAPALDPAELQQAQWTCQLVHLRFCSLLAKERGAPAHLTRREREILEWVSRGKSNESIAVILGLSPHTIDTYLRRIFEKLGVCDRMSAVLRGLATGQINSLM